MVLKHSTMINGYDSFNLTKLDVLDKLPEIKVGVKYMVDGKEISGFPGQSNVANYFLLDGILILPV